MFSIDVNCAQADKDLTIAELWEAGSTGIVELEDTETAARMRAFFDDDAMQAALAERYGTETQPADNRDWVAFAQEHLQPMKIGTRIFVVPEWRDDATPEGRIRIVTNAGWRSAPERTKPRAFASRRSNAASNRASRWSTLAADRVSSPKRRSSLGPDACLPAIPIPRRSRQHGKISPGRSSDLAPDRVRGRVCRQLGRPDPRQHQSRVGQGSGRRMGSRPETGRRSDPERLRRRRRARYCRVNRECRRGDCRPAG